MRLEVSSVSFVALILERCRLLCEALVAASCCFTFETSTMQKPRVFQAFQTKINTNQRRKALYLRHFRKNLTNKKENKTQKKSPKHHLVHENHTTIEVFKLLIKNPPKNKCTPRAAADATTTLLLLRFRVISLGFQKINIRYRLPSLLLGKIRFPCHFGILDGLLLLLLLSLSL